MSERLRHSTMNDPSPPPQECQNSAFDLVFGHDASKFNSLIVLIPEG